jgi:hypothetical protein
VSCPDKDLAGKLKLLEVLSSLLMLIILSEIWRELVQHHSWGPAGEDTRGAGSSPYSAQVLIHPKLSKKTTFKLDMKILAQELD